MSANQDATTLLLHLRRLAAERPREARVELGRLLDERPAELRELLTLMGAPGEGRLRHVVAGAVRIKPARAESVPHLARWLKVETDEFTKNALRGALAALPESASDGAATTSQNSPPVSPAFVEAYRYAAGRLSHRVRNALGEPQTSLFKLNNLLDEASDTIPRAAVVQIAMDLATGFRKVARIVEFDTDDGYFEIRRVTLGDWLESMNADYARRYGPIGFKYVGNVDVRIQASEYLLSTIFWNLWTNAHQATGANCQITVVCEAGEVDAVRILVLDNGDGLPAEAQEAAFVGSYSTNKAKHRGRGLLEVQDAAERLHGRVQLVLFDGSYRLQLELPQVIS